MRTSSNDTISGHFFLLSSFFFPSVVWPVQMMLTAEKSKAAFLTRSEDHHPSSSVSKPQLWYAGLGSLLGHQADCKNVGK